MSQWMKSPLQNQAAQQMLQQAQGMMPQQGVPSASISMSMPMMPAQMSPQERIAMQKSRAKIENLMATQANKNQSQIQQMRQSLEDYKRKPRGTDWSPALGFIDFMNKGQSNLAATYNQSSLRPESERAKMGNILRMENQISNQQNKATSNEVNLAKAHLQSLKDRVGQSAQMRYASRMRGQNMSMSRFLENESNDAQKEIFGHVNKTTQKALEDAQLFSMIDAGFTPNPETGKPDYQRVMSSLGNYVRSVGGEKGVLTDQDIERVLPRNFEGGLAKFKAMLSGQAPTADLPADFTKVLREMVQLAKQKTGDKYKTALSTHKEGANQLPYYKSVEQYTNPVYDLNMKKIDDAFVSTLDAPKEKSPEIKRMEGKDTGGSQWEQFQKSRGR